MTAPTHSRPVVLAPPAERLPEAALVAISRASRPRKPTTLGDAATAAVDTCARAYRSDQRDLPADQADERLWGPFAGTNYDERDDDV